MIDEGRVRVKLGPLQNKKEGEAEMHLLKRLPKFISLIAAVVVIVFIVITLFTHFQTSANIKERRENIQQRAEWVINDDKGREE